MGRSSPPPPPPLCWAAYLNHLLTPASASCKELSRAVCAKINEVVQRQEPVPLPAAPAPAAGQSTRATARHCRRNRKPNRARRLLGRGVPSCFATLSP